MGGQCLRQSSVYFGYFGWPCAQTFDARSALRLRSAWSCTCSIGGSHSYRASVNDDAEREERVGLGFGIIVIVTNVVRPYARTERVLIGVCEQIGAFAATFDVYGVWSGCWSSRVVRVPLVVSGTGSNRRQWRDYSDVAQGDFGREALRKSACVAYSTCSCAALAGSNRPCTHPFCSRTRS
jgi:hypothetical protein